MMTRDSLYDYDDFPVSWMRVLFRLHLAKLRHERHTYGQKTAPAGWIPIYEVQQPEVGGSAGDVRLRDLRNKYLVPMMGPQPFPWKDRHGNKHITYLYKLGCTLDDSDFTEIIFEGSKWRYEPVEEQMEML